MKIVFKKRPLKLILLVFLTAALDTSGQVKSAYSMSAAYSVLNAGTSNSAGATYVGNTSTGAAYVGNASPVIKVVTTPSLGYLGPLNKKWNINFGIPTQVVFDYAYLRGTVVNAYESDKELYWNGSAEFQNAVDFLGWTDFAPISSWAPVRCTVKFRFIPPVLGDNYDLRYDYRNNPSSAPERGTVTFWIR